MKFWLLNTFKFLAYIAPFLFGFSLITISAMNGTFLQPIIYFGILALTMMLLSQIKLNKDILFLQISMKYAKPGDGISLMMHIIDLH